MKRREKDNYSNKIPGNRKRNLCLLIYTKSLKKKQITTRKI